ncbi:unnamed protein product [Parnassius mnemosyne]|uniref:Uncharacterized protein n=1 Tax=Parnassius mnemosyne TaxID=213953 RepID=A0AAV1KEY0_9NEOP
MRARLVQSREQRHRGTKETGSGTKGTGSGTKEMCKAQPQWASTWWKYERFKNVKRTRRCDYSVIVTKGKRQLCKKSILPKIIKCYHTEMR